MKVEPQCPICKSINWLVIGQRSYLKADTESFNNYIQARYRVLFEVWLPDQEEITLTSKLCQDCGFVTYTPRPDSADIEAKYKFLSKLDNTRVVIDPESIIESKRSLKLFRYIKSQFPLNNKTRILDFGGGDGHLMREFISYGADCYLIDTTEAIYSGVTHIGYTEGDLLSEQKFEVIVCSHVIEHVEYPRMLIYEAMRVAKYVYVEVPLEDTARLSQNYVFDKVGHINYYSPKTIRRLLQTCNLHIMDQKIVNPSKEVYCHKAGKKGLVNYYIKQYFLRLLPALATRSFAYES